MSVAGRGVVSQSLFPHLHDSLESINPHRGTEASPRECSKGFSHGWKPVGVPEDTPAPRSALPNHRPKGGSIQCSPASWIPGWCRS